MADREISITVSGNGSNNVIHDTKQQVNFLYIFQENLKASGNLPLKKLTYKGLLDIEYAEKPTVQPILLNFTDDSVYRLEPKSGLFPLLNEGNYYSFLRQEYIEDTSTSPSIITYAGPWMPVVINSNNSYIIDYNISNGRKYKYIVYPTTFSDSERLEQYANNGIGVETNWDSWSLTELIPVKTETESPSIKQQYKVISDGVWLFKYDVETGEQVQNFVRTERQNLSMFPRFSQGNQNYLSGSVSCKLGSEIVPYTEGYVERLKSSITTPLSSNEKIDLLKAWRKMVFSKNPKLLKDRKGQSFLVTINSNTNKPQENISSQPDVISFSWTQIGTLENIAITGS